jgi:ATP-dependent protease ClpP protease subunit
MYLLIIVCLLNSIDSRVITLNQTNHIIIQGQINSVSTNKFIIDTISFNESELFIYINSPGGSVIEGLMIIDHIKTLQNDNITISCIADYSASMAFVILQFCSNRYALYSSIIMQHQMSLKLGGNLFELNSYLKMIKDINIFIDTKQSQRINTTYNEFVNKVSIDWWISGITAVEEKIVDMIIMIKCSKYLYLNNYTIEYNTLFGDFNLVYSRCPLIRRPLQINSPAGINKEILEIVDNKNQNYLKF